MLRPVALGDVSTRTSTHAGCARDVSGAFGFGAMCVAHCVRSRRQRCRVPHAACRVASAAISDRCGQRVASGRQRITSVQCRNVVGSSTCMVRAPLLLVRAECVEDLTRAAVRCDGACSKVGRCLPSGTLGTPAAPLATLSAWLLVAVSSHRGRVMVRQLKTQLRQATRRATSARAQELFSTQSGTTGHTARCSPLWRQVAQDHDTERQPRGRARLPS